MALGRPTKYQEDYPEKLIQFMKQGYSYEDFAAEVMVSRDTLYEWEKKHPAFSDAKRIGQPLSEKWWLDVGRAGMTGKLKGFNATVWVFTMKCRHKWKEDAPSVTLSKEDSKLIINLGGTDGTVSDKTDSN